MTQKTFYYDRLLYFFDVKVTGLFCGIIILACFYLGIIKLVNPLFLAFISLISAYTIWNCFISKSNTQKVKISDDNLSFYSLGKEDSYAIKEIKRLRIREFPTGGKMYIRINDSNCLKGRYWIQFKKFNDSRELMMRLLDIEYALHPETLKARARRVNTKYLELEKNQKLSK